MIRNIVFDIGGVLMAFDTHALTAHFAGNEADGLLLHRETFENPVWVGIDRAAPEDWALERIQSRLPERLREPAAQVMAQWDKWLIPDREINALAEELAGMGYPLYILSNTSARFYQFRERIPAWPLFTGAILSYEERLLKPDPEIYRRLFSRFGLAPGECFFVDNSHINVEAAGWVGMAASLYLGDISQVRADLRRAGVPVAS